MGIFKDLRLFFSYRRLIKKNRVNLESQFFSLLHFKPVFVKDRLKLNLIFLFELIISTAINDALRPFQDPTSIIVVGLICSISSRNIVLFPFHPCKSCGIGSKFLYYYCNNRELPKRRARGPDLDFRAGTTKAHFGSFVNIAHHCIIS